MSAALARRYARALLEIGQADGNIRELERDLTALGDALDESPDLEAALFNPTVDAEAKRAIAEAVADKLKLSETTRNFVGLLLKKNRFGIFRLICEEYAQMAHEATGTVRARVTSAAELPDDVHQRLTDKLSKVTGKQVEVEQKIDPDLLGGLIAEVGGVVYDGSLATQLRTLRHKTTR